MSAEPLISVVIASYNHRPFVQDSLRSVVEQGIEALEILVTDDASTDGTAEAVAAFPDPRIRLHVHPHNRGACAAMNQAIGRARGQFIAVLNSDDVFLPGKLQAQLQVFALRPELGAVFGQPRFIDEHGAPLQAQGVSGSQLFEACNRSRHAWLAHFFDEGNALCHPTALIRRQVYQAVGAYDERLAQVPDLDMWIRLCRRFEIHVMPQPLTGFRILPHQANASAPRPEVVVRDAWERAMVLRRYLDLSAAELAAVFPDFQAARMSSTQFLTRRALAKPPGFPFFHRFALDALFDALPPQASDEATAHELRAFIERSGRTDVHRLYPPGTLPA